MQIFKIDSLYDAINYHNIIISCSDDEIVLDFTKSTFIRNNYISILGLALEIKMKENKKIKVIEPKNNGISNALKNIGFLSKYSNCTNGADSNNTMIKYTNIEKQDDYYEFYDYFVSQLNKKTKNLSSELSDKIMKKIYEQFSNVFRHSKSDLGFFCSGQFYPSQEKFYFTIVDGGITIKTNVNDYLKELSRNNKEIFNFRKYEDMSGYEAIKWALTDGNSTTGKGGFGLNLLQELILKSKGLLEIVSNDGYYKIHNGKESKEIFKDKFNGTIISIGLSTNSDEYYYLQDGGNKNDT